MITNIIQWFKNGDHPLDYAKEKVGFEKGELRTWTGEECKALGWEGQIVRYFRDPCIEDDAICQFCGHIMNHHGWIDQGEDGILVCPGNLIGTKEDGTYESFFPSESIVTYLKSLQHDAYDKADSLEAKLSDIRDILDA